MIDAAQVMRNMSSAAIDAMRNAYATEAAATQKTTETGAAQGMTLEVMADPAAELQDSMEEISMSFEDKKTTEIGKRKLGEMRNVRTDLVKSLQNWMKVLPDMPGAAFMERMMRNVRTLAARGKGPDNLLQMLNEGSGGDATVEYAMLETLEHAGNLDEATKKLLEQTKAQLMKTRGPDVKAGLNLANEINARAAASGTSVSGLRDLYRSEVLGFKSPQDCFRSLLAKGGVSGMSAQLDFLMKSCGIDMQSASPSRSMTELSRVLGDLQCVTVLKTVMDKAGALAGKMMAQFGEPCKLTGSGFMEKLLQLTERSFVTESNIAQLMQDTGLEKLLSQVYFMTGTIDLMRQLSPRLFDDESSRQRMIDAGQDHLDGLVDRQAEEDAKKQMEDD